MRRAITTVRRGAGAEASAELAGRGGKRRAEAAGTGTGDRGLPWAARPGATIDTHPPAPGRCHDNAGGGEARRAGKRGPPDASSLAAGGFTLCGGRSFPQWEAAAGGMARHAPRPAPHFPAGPLRWRLPCTDSSLGDRRECGGRSHRQGGPVGEPERGEAHRAAP